MKRNVYRVIVTVAAGAGLAMATAAPAPVDALVQDRFITANGLRLHYRAWGRAEAPPLMLLHGSGFASGSYDALARGLADRYYVIALDQRGHGRSDRAADYSWQPAVEDIDAFVEALDLSPVTMVGHSMGARIAAAYAGSRPDAVCRLVLLDWGPGATLPPDFARTLGSVLGRSVVEDIDELVAVLQASLPRLRTEAMHQALAANVAPREGGGWSWRFDPAVLRDGHAFQIDEETATSLMRRIAAPTLLVRAAASEVLSPARAARTVALLAAGQLVELPDTGHALPWEDPEGVLAVIRSFLVDGNVSDEGWSIAAS